MKKVLVMVLVVMAMAVTVMADADATATECVAGADAAYAEVIATVEAQLTEDSSPAALVAATETVVAAETSQADYIATCDVMASWTATPTEIGTATETETVTETSTTTSTPTTTPTVTLTSTATSVYQVVKNTKWTAYVQDILGNTYNAVNAYATVYEVANGRGSTVEKGWAKYNQAHVLVKKFRSEANWVRNLKTIRLILTPAAQSTARANFVLTVTPVYPLLEEAATYVSEAATVGSTPATNKIKVDNNFINEVATYIAE